MDRRRGSPPPRGDDRRHFGGDDQHGGPERFRRGRSRSPGFRRSPPPKRHRRDDDYGDERHGGGGGRHGRGPRQPMSFPEFAATLPGSITPDGAKYEFDRYMAGFWGNEVRAEFEQRRNDPVLRRQFDPREIMIAVESRDAAVQEAAVKFHEGDGGGEDDDGPPGPAAIAAAVAAATATTTVAPAAAPMVTDAPPSPSAAPAAAPEVSDDAVQPVVVVVHPKAPAVSLEESIVAADLTLARRLTRLLDAERGVLENPLVPPPPPPPPAAAAADAEPMAVVEGGRGGHTEQPQKQEEDGEPAAAAAVPTVVEPVVVAQGPTAEELRVAQEEEEAAVDAARSHEERCAALDAVLKYLWAVHGIDYYAGREFGGAADPSRAVARRTLRPEPVRSTTTTTAAVVVENGDEPMEIEKEKVKEEDATAAAAAGEGDESMPEADFKAETEKNDDDGVAKIEVEEEKEAPSTIPTTTTIAAAVPPTTTITTTAIVSDLDKARKAYEERTVKRWRTRVDKGDLLIRRMQKDRIEKDIVDFVDRQIVQHSDQKWGNKLSTKMFVARSFVVKHIRNKHAHVVDAERERILDIVYYENYKAAKDEEHRRPGRGGGGGGRGGRGRARGGGHGMPPHMQQHGVGAPMMMMDPSMMLGAPILMPAVGGGMAPMIMAPMGLMAMGGGGGRGGRGGGRGGRGGGRGGGYVQGGAMVPLPVGGGGVAPNYFDLDAPKNNRAVLDYGDL